MKFTETTLFKLSNIFGQTEVTLLLADDEIELILDEINSVPKYGGAEAHYEADNSIAEKIGANRFIINNTVINICSSVKFGELILSSDPQQ